MTPFAHIPYGEYMQIFTFRLGLPCWSALGNMTPSALCTMKANLFTKVQI